MKSFEIGISTIINWIGGWWTINLKSFEITIQALLLFIMMVMNYKLEKFWNLYKKRWYSWKLKWTINLKSFEILLCTLPIDGLQIWTINLKSFEISVAERFLVSDTMNYKLEKFWNYSRGYKRFCCIEWTINLKSFEMLLFLEYSI